MKLFKIYLFITGLFILNITVTAADIKGRVIDYETGEPLAGANIFLSGTKNGSATDIEGLYFITNVPPGIHILKARFIGYYEHLDTIEIRSWNEAAELNIVLRDMVEDLDSLTSPDLKTYHRHILESNKLKPVLSIYIDSLAYMNRMLYAYLSMKNNSEVPIQVSKNYICFKVIDADITNSRGEKIKENMALCCTGEKTCPESSDLLKIESGEVIKYPPTELFFYGFDYYPDDSYSVRVKYTFIEKKINTFFCGNIKVVTAILRGEYVSENSLLFSNTNYKGK